jgi:DNA-directed RNA polymerase specialized sigma24 family protein
VDSVAWVDKAGTWVVIDEGKSPANESAPDRERAALAQLIEEYQQPLGSYLLHLTGEADVALVLTRETFVCAYRAKAASGPGPAVRPWLYRTATCLAYTHLRRHRRRSAPVSGWVLAAPAEAEGGEPALVQSVLGDLPLAERAILLLCDLEHLPFDEAAAVLSVSTDRLRERLGRARAHFSHAYVAQLTACAGT